ncbi:MAG TPA: ester cyclase [Dinghuibacter sp.]|uniref:ester cyclase n=1 Tax=Dinghuibacter sp. TaxID=2024697 RepID=UPI002B689BD5|nr:ester cyclase [Dinghuibacter sp.]HTJ12097.1 ester cyclase [Dinghuibacter sp.]
MIAAIITHYIERTWNNGAVPDLHPDYVDHGLPPDLPPTAEGVRRWIALTSASFEHHTVIDHQLTEGDKSIVLITMRMRHIGTWRGIPPTFKEVSIRGYRLFRVADGKIIEHWALIDGNALEKALRPQGL